MKQIKPFREYLNDSSKVYPSAENPAKRRFTGGKYKGGSGPDDFHRKGVEHGDIEKYQKFFKATLKKWKVKSMDDLNRAQKVKFMDFIDKNWKG
jgi:hypothetical protein